MGNVRTLQPDEERLDAASLWISRMDRGLSRDERSDLCSWIEADPANRAALLELARTWDRMDAVAVLSEVFPDNPAPKARPLRWAPAAAAMVAILAVAGALVLMTGPGDQASHGPDRGGQTAGYEVLLRTAVGERSSVGLPDGSELTLNTDTRLRVAFSDDDRRLDLEHGELSIDVAPDPDRPLIVFAGGSVMQAIGTSFTVSALAGREVELLVMEGRVRVSPLSPAPGAGRLRPGKASDARSDQIVKAGQALAIAPAGHRTVDLSEAEIRARLAWRDGRLVFGGETLDEALAEVGRYTPMRFEIPDSELRAVRVAGVFRAGDVEGLLATLAENFDIAYRRVAEDRIVLERAAEHAASD